MRAVLLSLMFAAACGSAFRPVDGQLTPMVPAAALAVTPVSGGGAGGTVVVINNGPDDKTDPHVNGDLAAYTVGAATRSIRYYRFSTAIDAAVPSVPGATDSLSDISGNNIVFSRASGGCDSIMVFNVSTGATAEVAPASCPQRFGASIGSSTVAFTDFATGSGVTFVADLAGGVATQLSSGAETTQNPEVAPNGNAVVWEQCSTLTSCDVMRSVRSGGAWGAAALVVAASNNPDTDGTTVVYDSSRVGNPTGRDIYFQPLGGGAETQLQLAGEQSSPSIYGGVIGFESRTSAGAPADIFIYVIATNTVYQVTNTPTIDDRLNDVTLLPTGEVRIVWASNDGLFGVNNVYGRTFTVPLGTSPTVQIQGLIGLIQGFSLPKGISTSLEAKLNDAIAALQAGDTATACSDLASLISEARAQSGKKLSVVQANQIIDAATRIRQSIPC